MIRSRARFPLLALSTSAVWQPAMPAAAQAGRPEIDKQVLVFLVDRVSFEELLAVPEITALARAGGAALMSPRTVPGDRGPGAYLTLGTGTRSAGPDDRVLGYDLQEQIEGRSIIEIYERSHEGRDPTGSPFLDRKSTRLNSSHIQKSRMPSSA